MDIKQLSFPWAVKATSVQNEDGVNYGYFEGYASTFGNEDLSGDVVMKGAFVDTLKSGIKVKMLWQHNWDQPIGSYTGIKEDDKGLFVQGKINLDTQQGKEAYSLLKGGDLDSMSIGYCTKNSTYDEDDNICYLNAVDLYEISIVSMPANPKAMITTVKSAIPSSLPLAPAETVWEKSAAIARVKKWADAEDAPNAKFKKAFLWYDATKADEFGSYKLPVGDVIDGTLKAVPRAISAVKAALNGGRGGVDIPDADKKSIMGTIDKYEDKMGDDKPDGDSDVDDAGKSLPTIRELETLIRDVYGVSKNSATTLALKGLNGFKEPVHREDVRENDESDVDKVNKALSDIMTSTKLNQLLKDVKNGH